jgi:ferredoxin
MAFTVEFKKSGKTIEWEERFGSILELAEDHGIEIDKNCRQGVCGTCAVKLDLFVSLCGFSSQQYPQDL